MNDWLVGNMGTLGDYSYQENHLISVAVVTAVLIFVVLAGRSKCLDDNIKGKILQTICWFQLGFEVLWRVLYVTVMDNSISCWWPLYPCNLGGLLLPVIALLGCKRGKDMFYLFGFLGGVITFALPEGIFVRDVLVFPILKSILQHTGLLLIPALEVAWGRWRPSFKTMGWAAIGYLIHIVNSEGITRLLGYWGDYMFFRSNLPFVIPGVPQFITLTLVGTVLMALISAGADLGAKKR